jgi:hypothetical protein
MGLRGAAGSGDPAPKSGETPIDAFLRAKFEARGLSAAPAADRGHSSDASPTTSSGCRRLRGNGHVLEGRRDGRLRQSSRTFAASPHYGERWGRHWLDLARYAVVREDGQAKNKAASEIYEAWRYRDWVVDAFNRDMPYDDFVRHQVAGDLIPPKQPGGVNVEGIVASGFLAIGEWGIQDDNPEKMIWDTADENIDAIGRTFLGLTLSCTRCHDHKFDPLTTRDYYALAASSPAPTWWLSRQDRRSDAHAADSLVPQEEIDEVAFQTQQGP